MSRGKHPATFNDAILDTVHRHLDGRLPSGARLLDPFAGTGRGVDAARGWGYDAVGVEIEPEWAAMSPHVIRGDALHLPFPNRTFDAVFTSPCYGNRMADKDMRPSCAGTYAKGLGRLPTGGSAAVLQWGDAYRAFHLSALAEIRRVLRPAGLFALNIKDHIRAGKPQMVHVWWFNSACAAGFTYTAIEPVVCGGLRRGRNHGARVDVEWVASFEASP